MGNFQKEHGYAQGTYEGKLDAAGINSAEIVSSGKYGKNINPNEYNTIMAGQPKAAPVVTNSNAVTAPVTGKMNGITEELGELTSKDYQFDPNEFLPGITEQADTIYDPQQAELEALSKITEEQVSQAKVETQESFDNRMQQETEALNNRGAYFSGGAIRNEQQIRTEGARAQNILTQQGVAAFNSNQYQQALLAVDKSSFIQDQLYNNESSAYARWSDDRSFDANNLMAQWGMYESQRDFINGVFTDDRDYNEGVRQSDRNFAEGVRQFDRVQEREDDKMKLIEEEFGLTKEQAEMAKEEWQYNMKVKGWNFQQTMNDFAKKANKNTGGLGLTADGSDFIDASLRNYEQGQNSQNYGGMLDYNGGASTGNFYE